MHDVFNAINDVIISCMATLIDFIIRGLGLGIGLWLVIKAIS